jgi:acyl homoserine lactone synthase
MEILTGNSFELSPGVMTDLSRYRHRVFVEKLGWDLNCADGRELDQFDGPQARYVIGRNSSNDIIASARLLPTTRPYLLSEVFPYVLNGQPVPRSPEIWELSRFASVDFTATTVPTVARRQEQSIAVELLRACLAYAATHGARRVITVSPIGIERLLQRAGIAMRRAGPPTLIDGHPIFACLIDCENARFADVERETAA